MTNEEEKQDTRTGRQSEELSASECSQSDYLFCDGCGKIHPDTLETIGDICECGRLFTRMEWATSEQLKEAGIVI